MLRSAILVGAVALGALGSSGCATSWALMRVSGAEWSTSRLEEVQPSAERERQVRLAPRYVPPTPEPAPQVHETAPSAAEAPPLVLEQPPSVSAEPAPVHDPSPPVSEAPAPAHERPPPVYEPPPPVVAPPPPQPELTPLPAGSLAFQCELLERPVTERVRVTEWQYEKPIWPLVIGLFFVGEAAIATSAFMNAPREKTVKDRNVTYAIAGAFALDALGLIAVALHPEDKEVHELVRPGTWTRTTACPDDLWIAHGGTQVRIERDGSVAAPMAQELVLALADPRMPLRARWGTRELSVRPSADARCRWAREQGVEAPQAFCRHPPDAPVLLPDRIEPLTIHDPALPLPAKLTRR